MLGPQDHWDPQRTYVGADIEFASRVFARTLTTYSAGATAKLVPDLATDLGTMTDAGKTWKFTLRDGVKWEDGKDIACEDVKYGVSRTYAQDVITGGPNYTITFLDIPTKKNAKGDTVPAYEGPYTKVGQDLFDKAVTCEGKTITFHFKTRVDRLQRRQRGAAGLGTVPGRQGPGRQVRPGDLLVRPLQARRRLRPRQGRQVRPQHQLGPGHGRDPQGQPGRHLSTNSASRPRPRTSG